MAVEPEELKKYQDKKVVLHTINPDGSVTEREGKVEASSPQGLAFKEKGKSSLDLYEIAQIEEIGETKEGPKKIRQKKLKLVDADQVRQHLVDRHGMPLSRANSMSESEAVELHNRIDHSDLGHRHEAEEETSQEKAIADAEAQAAGQQSDAA